MENNKPTIEDDIKNIYSKIKKYTKEKYQFLDFKFLKDYDKDIHLGLFFMYNLIYIIVFGLWFIHLILGGELIRPDFTIIGFTMDYFFTGELVTLDAWKIHLLINIVLFFKCLDYGKTKRNKRNKKVYKFQTKEEILEKYRKRGWRVPPKNDSDGKD
jgi:hypothetical protein